MFADSASEDLNKALDTMREKHFLPAYMNRRQRNLMFKEKYKSQLENSPAKVTLGDEDFPLVHVNKHKDVPARGPLVNSIIKMMRENGEWDHLPSLLDGLHAAKASPSIETQEKMIRQAATDEQFDVILSCLKKVDDTGMTLKNDDILHWVLRGLRLSPAKHDWNRKYLAKALKQSWELAMIFEQKGHTRGKTPRDLTSDDPRKNPSVIGYWLELYAMNAVRYQKSEDRDGNVKKYADRALSCLQQSEVSAHEHGLQSLTDDD